MRRRPARYRSLVKPGGRIGLANWTPTGGLAKMFKVMAAFQPAPPPSSPFAWGDEARVRELLGDAFDLTLEERVSTLTTESAEEYWDCSRRATARRRRSRTRRRPPRRLHRAWVDFFNENYSSNGEIVHPREYLLILGTRR